MTQGIAHCDNVQLAMRAVEEAAQKLEDNTTTFRERWNVSKAVFYHDVQVARKAFKEQGISHLFLPLEGTIARSFAKWLAQARLFYTTLLNQPEYLALVAPWGITEGRIRQVLAQLDELDALEEVIEALTQEKADAIVQQKAAQKARKAWSTTFLGVARVILAPYPTYRALLSFRTTRRPSKKVLPPTDKPIAEPIQSRPTLD